MPVGYNHLRPISPQDLLASMQRLRADVCSDGTEIFERWQKRIARRAFLPGALNLAHYLAFRQHDLRPLQMMLRPYGLSSLGRSESNVMASIDAVIATLSVLAQPGTAAPPRPRPSAFFRGERMLSHNTAQLFGQRPSYEQRQTHIMVTFPSEAATDPGLVRELVRRGMDIARINCAHDNPDAWRAMIHNVRQAQADLGREVRIHMDLSGPKARTAAIQMPKKTVLKVGDVILLTKDRPTPLDDYPVQVQCALPEVFGQIRVGHRISFDDGEMATEIEALKDGAAVLRVRRVPEGGFKLKEEKGLNFPDTDLRLDPLTEDDLEALDFVAVHADTIGYSFVQEPGDIERLQTELRARTDQADRLGIIIKIETLRALRNLPELIVAAGGRQPVGVMIARGDLAVEIGFERMTEIQEQILWLCEAAYVPVIWATQVLEKFVKKGTPSRSEMTDAAMAVRAECVMLNKGPYVAEAVTILNDVLSRMSAHQRKKVSTLRALKAWASLIER
jgi:pyruvate kinase